ncbi:exocyst complex component 7-like [Stegodyphus dumicola]|uniref:exocyst complex component 7-like n=1 Tax=Stegodyphus dumicola TaxID=202533 RepID=UPI0015A76BC8|nr:exocyst complex component 7-like [Stegodyphus dumicola]
MPKDGTVHQLTSNAIMLLEQLQDYQDILGSVLTLQDTSFATSKDKRKLSFAQYITRVLSALSVTLQNKSEAYSDQYLRAIFRMNNLHYIVKALHRTGLLEIVQIHNPGVESYYNDQIRDQKRVYSQSWSRVLHYVMEVDKPISHERASLNTARAPTSLKLREKDKQNIKDKFAGFNKEMEEITRTQKAYAVPDVELRESLKRDNKEFILPKYTMFYEKYIDAGFTKNTEKYIKYTPTDVSNTIDTFFDAAA